MSLKIKFPSNSSTPTKSKLTLNQTSSSPTKGSKYKSLLAAVLTPSQTKKWLKRKKSIKSEESFKEDKSKLEDIDKDSEISDNFCEPTYSTIQDLPIKPAESVIHSSPIPNAKFCESSFSLPDDKEHSYFNSAEEPLYSTVNKEKKNKTNQPDIACRSNSSQNQFSDKTNSECTSDGEVKKDLLNEELVEEQKEEIKLLRERIKELATENRELHKHIETIIRDEKWKEESLHANLKFKITQLEADTHKEVNCLSEQIRVLQKERKVLSDQVQMLHEENKLVKKKNEDLYKEIKSMVSAEFMKKKMDEQEMLLNQIKKSHLEEVKKLQEKNEVLTESKVILMTEVEDLREKSQFLSNKNDALRASEQEILQEKSRILLQLEESKQMQQEAENMLISLLKISEAISIERDVLLNKSSFQDHQQKLLQSTMMNYSLNMGRLQEHISTIGKEKLEELKKLKLGELQRDESMKKFYEKQLDLLQSKIVSQSNVINDLENEKSKLELQLESLWQAVCSEKSKVGDNT